MRVSDPGWLAGHQLVDPYGVEIKPETVMIINPLEEGERQMQFHSISRAPGDGTGTNGKILATITDANGNPWRSEFYPLPGYRIVPREGFDAEAYYASH